MRYIIESNGRCRSLGLFGDIGAPVSKQMLLQYSSKETEQQILSHISTSNLVAHGTFGSTGRNGTSWKNLIIKGDNLIALQSLIKQKNLKEKVDLIYIDPPFSTNQIFRKGTQRTATISSSKSDEVAYEDILDGPEYVEYIRWRLILLKKILSQEGSIYIHIDYKIGHYVKIIMDEIFSRKNFINDITRIKCNPKNFKRKGYGNIKDLILFYAKSEDYIWNNSVESFADEDIEKLFSKIDKKGRRYTTTPLHAPGETRNGATGQPWKNLHPPKGRHWRYSPQELTILDKEGLIEWSSTGNPRKIIYADEKLIHGKKKQDIWEYKDPPNPRYPTEKNLKMIQSIIRTSSKSDSIVLDCFAGSGTTAIAAENEKRKWIVIDSSNISIQTIKERLLSSGETISPFSILEVV